MNLIENFKIAMESITANKMRSFLTMLGIIIGISSVITIVSLGSGGQNAIAGEFEKIGASTINIKVDAAKAQTSDYITTDDIKQLKEKIDTVKYVSPIIQKQGIASIDQKSGKAVIVGANTDYGLINNYEMLYGRFFNEREYEEDKNVVVIDDAAAESLFGYTNAVGKTIKIGSKTSMKNAVIVGVYKGMTNIFGGDKNNLRVYAAAPLGFTKELFSDTTQIDTIAIVSSSKDNLEQTGTIAANMLESRHNNRGQGIYQPENVMKQLEQINKVLGIFTTFISAVAAISLIVGGIGVMNIMLVSVTERTREIGIRKAIGATTSAILLQFLTEALIISLIGGTIGIIIGVLGAQIIGSFAGITPSVSISVVVIALLFSSAVGIFFGIYPAKKAARLDPIEALRYE